MTKRLTRTQPGRYASRKDNVLCVGRIIGKAEKGAKWAGLCDHCRPIVAKHVWDFREGPVKQGLCRCNRGSWPPGSRCLQWGLGGERFREFYGGGLLNRSKKKKFFIHA